MEQYEQELLQYLRDNEFYHEAYISNDVLHIDIQWGDWKHDHWNADYLVKEFFEQKPEIYKVVTTKRITEEDGSDCYSAIHLYKIIKK